MRGPIHGAVCLADQWAGFFPMGSRAMRKQSRASTKVKSENDFSNAVLATRLPNVFKKKRTVRSQSAMREAFN